MGEDLVSGVGGLGVSLWLYRQHRDPTLAKCARVGHPSCPELEQKGQKPGPPADGQSQIFEFKGLTRKILKTKEIGRPDPFPVQPYRYGVANGVLKSTTNLEIIEQVLKSEEKGVTVFGHGPTSISQKSAKAPRFRLCPVSQYAGRPGSVTAQVSAKVRREPGAPG